MSPTLFSQRLKQLEAEGIIERKTSPDGKSQEYSLTPAGEEFAPVIDALGTWGQRWSRRELMEGEIDLGLFIWALERSVNSMAFGNTRTTIRLELTDQEPEAAYWWFVNENNSVEICLQDPGYEINIYLAGLLPDFIYLIRGDISLNYATENDKIEVLGERKYINSLPEWLNLGPLTQIQSRRK